jgi:hypothetical protein
MYIVSLAGACFCMLFHLIGTSSSLCNQFKLNVIICLTKQTKNKNKNKNKKQQTKNETKQNKTHKKKIYLVKQKENNSNK